MPTSVKPKVAVLALHIQEHAQFQAFSEKFQLIPYKLVSKCAFREDLSHGGPLDDISAIFADWPGFYSIGGMSKDVVDMLPATLKLIVVPSVGYDLYDVKALKQRGIVLCNTPSISAPAVAETALLLTLSVYRYASAFEQAVRCSGNVFDSKSIVENMDKRDAIFGCSGNTGDNTGSRQCSTTNPMANEFTFGSKFARRFPVTSPSGQRVGIAGFGCIGQLIGRRLADLGMQVHYHKRNQLTDMELKVLGYPAVYHCSLESLLQQSDLLVLVLPGTPDTRHILNRRTLSLLPQGAKVVNVGRGSLINEAHLLEALQTGHISSVGLDVYEDETSINKDLLSRMDVTVVPHVGACTAEVYNESVSNCMRNLVAFFDQGSALTPV